MGPGKRTIKKGKLLRHLKTADFQNFFKKMKNSEFSFFYKYFSLITTMNSGKDTQIVRNFFRAVKNKRTRNAKKGSHHPPAYYLHRYHRHSYYHLHYSKVAYDNVRYGICCQVVSTANASQKCLAFRLCNRLVI